MADPVETPEPFSLGKWLSGFFNGVSNAKDMKTVFFIGFLVLAGFTIWKAYFVKTQQQTQKNTTCVTAQSGSHVVVEAPKQEMRTGGHWSLGPFVGGSTKGDIIGGIIVLYNF